MADAFTVVLGWCGRCLWTESPAKHRLARPAAGAWFLVLEDHATLYICWVTS